MYGVEVSPTLISNVTDEVIDEVKQWNRMRSLTLNSLLRNGTSNIRQSANLGAVIGRILSASFLSHLRCVERFI